MFCGYACLCLVALASIFCLAGGLGVWVCDGCNFAGCVLLY